MFVLLADSSGIMLYIALMPQASVYASDVQEILLRAIPRNTISNSIIRYNGSTAYPLKTIRKICQQYWCIDLPIDSFQRYCSKIYFWHTRCTTSTKISKPGNRQLPLIFISKYDLFIYYINWNFICENYHKIRPVIGLLQFLILNTVCYDKPKWMLKTVSCFLGVPIPSFSQAYTTRYHQITLITRLLICIPY